MRICNYNRAGLVLSLLFFFHVKSLAAPYYRLKSTKPLSSPVRRWFAEGTVRGRAREEREGRRGGRELRSRQGEKGSLRSYRQGTRGTLITGLA